MALKPTSQDPLEGPEREEANGASLRVGWQCRWSNAHSQEMD